MYMNLFVLTVGLLTLVNSQNDLPNFSENISEFPTEYDENISFSELVDLENSREKIDSNRRIKYVGNIPDNNRNYRNKNRPYRSPNDQTGYAGQKNTNNRFGNRHGEHQNSYGSTNGFTPIIKNNNGYKSRNIATPNQSGYEGPKNENPNSYATGYNGYKSRSNVGPSQNGYSSQGSSNNFNTLKQNGNGGHINVFKSKKRNFSNNDEYNNNNNHDSGPYNNDYNGPDATNNGYSYNGPNEFDSFTEDEGHFDPGSEHDSTHSGEKTIHKHIYVHVPPSEPTKPSHKHHTPVQKPEKHYKIIFIKTPTVSPPTLPPISHQVQNEEKTLVYVLVPKAQQTADIPNTTPVPTTPSKPEVYFIRYKTDKENGKEEEGYQKDEPQQEGDDKEENGNFDENRGHYHNGKTYEDRRNNHEYQHNPHNNNVVISSHTASDYDGLYNQDQNDGYEYNRPRQNGGQNKRNEYNSRNNRENSHGAKGINNYSGSNKVKKGYGNSSHSSGQTWNNHAGSYREKS